MNFNTNKIYNLNELERINTSKEIQNIKLKVSQLETKCIKFSINIINDNNRNDNTNNEHEIIAKLSKEINLIKDQLKKLAPKEQIEEKINLLREEGKNVVEKVDKNSQDIKNHKKEIKNLNKSLNKIEKILEEER